MTARLRASVVAFLVSAAACGSHPTSPTGSVSVSTASAVAPAPGAQIPSGQQPVVLTVANATSTLSGATLEYTFEVATDTAFANRIQSKTTAESSTGQTSVTLDPLPAGQDYFWHVQVAATAGGTSASGSFSPPTKFTIGAGLTLDAPVPISPLSGASTFGWPQLVVANATHSGSTSSLMYQFEISTSSTFLTTVVSGLVPEGPGGRTTFTVPSTTPLVASTSFYWRATAIDQASAVLSQPSAAQSVSTQPSTRALAIAAQQGVTLWPGAAPQGAGGNATMGNGWDIGTLHAYFGDAFLSPPLDALRIFDLMDRGMSPQQAIDWLSGHGYDNVAQYYPSIGVIGLLYQYMAVVNGAWQLVVRVGA